MASQTDCSVMTCGLKKGQMNLSVGLFIRTFPTKEIKIVMMPIRGFCKMSMAGFSWGTCTNKLLRLPTSEKLGRIKFLKILKELS